MQTWTAAEWVLQLKDWELPKVLGIGEKVYDAERTIRQANL